MVVVVLKLLPRKCCFQLTQTSLWFASITCHGVSHPLLEDHELELGLDMKLIKETQPLLTRQVPVHIESKIVNVNRAVEKGLSNEVSKRYQRPYGNFFISFMKNTLPISLHSFDGMATASTHFFKSSFITMA